MIQFLFSVPRFQTAVASLFLREPSWAARQDRDKQTSAKWVYTTGQTRIFPASSILLRRSHAISTAEKSGPSIQNRRIYSSVSLGSEKSVQSGKIAPPRGAVVDYGLRGPAFSRDTPSSCFCLSPSASGSSDDTARVNPIQPTRIRNWLWPRNLHHLLGLWSKIRLQLQDEATCRFLGRP